MGWEQTPAVPIAGTPLFMAPEVVRGEEQSFAADIWALGYTRYWFWASAAPKRKRPRPVKLEEESPVIVAGRNGSISSAAAKVENQQPAKSEASSPKSEKNSGSASQNAGDSVDLSSQPAAAMSSFEPPQPEAVRAESNTASAPKPFTEESETRDGVQSREEAPSPKKHSVRKR